MLAPFVAHAVFSAGTESSEHRTMTHATVPSRQPAPSASVGFREDELEAHIASLGEIGLRRVRYAFRFIFWTARHRSTANAAWLCAYEGYQW